jgi:hypothetical protein
MDAEGNVDLAPEVADVDLHDVVPALETGVPHVVEYFPLRHDLVMTADEVFQ